MRPDWLSRLETLGTTAVVLMVGSMTMWHESLEHDSRRMLIIGGAALLYVTALVLLGRRSEPSRVAWWPFAIAGLATGTVAELINADFLVTRELMVAAVTGTVIGTAHWAALRVWIHLTPRREA
jgi:hypothetical protein